MKVLKSLKTLSCQVNKILKKTLISHLKLVNINRKGNINVSRVPAVSNPKNVPYYYQCHRFSLTGAFLCLTEYLRSVLFGKSLEVDILGLCARDGESNSQVLEPGLATEAYKLTSLLQRGLSLDLWN